MGDVLQLKGHTTRYGARSRLARRQHERAVNALRDEMEAEYRDVFQAALLTQYREALAILRLLGPAQAPHSITLRPEAMQEAMARTHGTVILRFARLAYSDLAAGKDLGDWIESWQSFVQQYIQQTALSRVLGIQRETVRRLRSILRQGIAEGEGTQALVDRIQERLPMMTEHRAERIARTEIMAASNVGADLGARSVAEEYGLRMERVWITSIDGRERPSHRAAHNATVPMEQPFTVGGHQMMHPGDSSLGAPASEIVNCRCVVGFQEAS